MTLKRLMPRSHGRATVLRKRSCHIHLVLAKIVESGKKEARKSKLEAPLKLEEVVAEAEKKSGTKKSTKSNTDTKAKTDTKSSKGFTTKVFNRKAGSK